MEKLESLMAQHPFFFGLDADLLKVIARYATHVRYEAGKMIYREGDEAAQFLLILGGKVAIEIFAGERGSLVIQTLGADDVLGWSWLFPPYKRSFDVRVIEPTETIALDGRMLRERAESDSHLGFELLKRFSKVVVERLKATRLQLIDVYGHHC